VEEQLEQRKSSTGVMAEEIGKEKNQKRDEERCVAGRQRRYNEVPWT